VMPREVLISASVAMYRLMVAAQCPSRTDDPKYGV
jgi:hypothetical protein